eukprot:m.12493 g.12493  ORF g.12493 m.12493 type:complete len:182 (+) comp17494_c0_seq2:1016-1561(+)
MTVSAMISDSLRQLQRHRQLLLTPPLDSRLLQVKHEALVVGTTVDRPHSPPRLPPTALSPWRHRQPTQERIRVANPMPRSLLSLRLPSRPPTHPLACQRLPQTRVPPHAQIHRSPTLLRRHPSAHHHQLSTRRFQPLRISARFCLPFRHPLALPIVAVQTIHDFVSLLSAHLCVLGGSVEK